MKLPDWVNTTIDMNDSLLETIELYETIFDMMAEEAYQSDMEDYPTKRYWLQEWKQNWITKGQNRIK